MEEAKEKRKGVDVAEEKTIRALRSSSPSHPHDLFHPSSWLLFPLNLGLPSRFLDIVDASLLSPGSLRALPSFVPSSFPPSRPRLLLLRPILPRS